MAAAVPYTATQTGRALLAAMDVEEPFRLLSSIPERLQELRIIEGRKESTVRQLSGDVVANQSHNHESISSGLFQIYEWRNEVESLLDLRLRHLQGEMDNIQELLEEIHNNRRPNTLPRRYRAQEKIPSELSNELSNLQDTNKRIHEITHYICGQAEWLATDRQTLYRLIHQIAHDMDQPQGECDVCEQGGGFSACTDITVPERGEDTMPNWIRDMRRRCEEVEAAILHNDEIIARQVEEIDRLRQIILH